MTIKIQLKSTIIPVEIGELEFGFDTADHSLKDMRKKVKETEKKIDALYEKVEEVTEDNEEQLEEEAKAVLAESFDTFLGEGAFEAIYKQTPSAVLLSGYFVELAEGLVAEMASNQKATKQDIYLKKHQQAKRMN